MRTKTLLLSALLGALGSVSVHAQNVYSLNAVGYINVTFAPATYTILTVPLQASPDNTLNTLLPNTNGQYKKAQVFAFADGGFTVTEFGVSTNANATGWATGGADISLTPGSAVWFYNPTAAAMTATFVGTVLTGPQTNALIPGFNLIGSIVPASGDLSTNSIMEFTNFFKHDYVYTFDPVAGYSGQDSIVAPGVGTGYNNEWTLGDPIISNVYDGFWYYNNSAAANSGTGGVATTNNWVENYSVGGN
jgi:hypothetical protein